MWGWLSPGWFMPHGHCYLWEPAMVWLQVTSNLLIGLAYMSISGTLWYLARRIEDVPFRWMYVAFGVFIVTCGWTHFFDVWTIWTPVYWLDGTVRVVTALASVGTAILLVPLVPKALVLARAARTAQERGRQLEIVNEENRMLAEGIPQLVCTTDPAGVVQYYNRRWLQYSGEPPSSLEHLRQIIHPDDLDEAYERWSVSLETGEPYRCELRLRRHDGVYRWHLGMASPLRDGAGKIIRWFATNTDIDDQKQAEAARQAALERMQEALRSREVFIAVAAHELKTPLTPLRLQIEGMLQTIRQGRAERLTPERSADKLSIAIRQVDRLENLVDGLLDVSRLDSGILELQLEDVDLRSVVCEVAERHRVEIYQACSQLDVQAQEGLVGRWDRLRLEQVITNLLTNALKFCREKPIDIRTGADRGMATISVSDRGPGIAPEDQGRIFQRFERIASARHYGGLGLGLWIAAEITKAMGGRIHVTSEPGEGSTFTVELPLAQAEAG